MRLFHPRLEFEIKLATEGGACLPGGAASTAETAASKSVSAGTTGAMFVHA